MNLKTKTVFSFTLGDEVQPMFTGEVDKDSSMVMIRFPLGLLESKSNLLIKIEEWRALADAVSKILQEQARAQTADQERSGQTLW